MRQIRLFLLASLMIMPINVQAQEKQTYIPKGINWTGPAKSGGNSSGENHIHIPKGINWQNNAGAIARHIKRASKAASGKKSNKQEIKKVDISIIHPNYLEPQQFGLLMKLANSQTGCFDYSPIEFDSSFIEGHFMDIKLNGYRKNLIETQNPHYDCKQTEKVVSNMIVLDANELRAKGVRQIRFNNGQSRDAYDVTFTDNSVRLTPESMIAFKAKGLVGPDFNYMEHVYTDQTLVSLQVPMALPSDDVKQAVRNLAYKHSLVPIFDKEAPNKFYFKDENGEILDRLAEQSYTELGTVQILRPYINREGRGGTPINLKVFLTKPNVSL